MKNIQKIMQKKLKNNNNYYKKYRKINKEYVKKDNKTVRLKTYALIIL